MGNWIVPLSVQRVSSQANKEMVGAKQLDDLLTDKNLPFGETFCVEVADSAYSKPAYLECQSGARQSRDDCTRPGNTHFLSSTYAR
jgi:hypothetical protein